VKEVDMLVIDIGDLCTDCGRDTAFGSGNGLFVNRIPSGADGQLILDGGDDVTLDITIDGYMCPECQMVECDECGNPTIDYKMQDTNPPKLLCEDCLEKESKQRR
jgi:hypothetical protein